MKCQECGNELEEGKLYCEICGKDVQIVPVFDSEIEMSISETLSAVAENFQQEESSVIMVQNVKQRKIRQLIVGIVIISMVSFIVSGIFFIYQSQSFEFQKAKAVECAAKMNYSDAIEYANKALSLETTNVEIRLLLSDYYKQHNEIENSVIVLREIISIDPDNETAYRNLIKIFEAKKDYNAINRLLLSGNSKEIVKTFQKYIAYPPEYSYPEGNYNEVIAIKLSANTTGKIYYTLDGSIPNRNSEVYTAPLILESGEYQINSVFVNEFGVLSEVVKKQYLIDVAIPPAPEVSPKTGVYNMPTMIEVNVPALCDVYYTTDGSLPTQDSILYTNPIAMTIGNSNFKFVAYSSDGIGGEITSRQYTLSIQTAISIGEAVNLLVPALQEKGVILDFEGNLPNLSGHNVYIASTIIDVGGLYYYLVVEYHVDLLGTYTKTGNIYGVGGDSGLLYKIVVNPDGTYTPIPFE